MATRIAFTPCDSQAVKSITDECPEAAGKIEMLQIDVTDDASCAAAAAALKAKGVSLYALVNNAGMGLAQEGAAEVKPDTLLNTNFYGPKRVTEAFVDLIDPKEGRIINTSSGACSMYLKKQDAKLKALFSGTDLTFEKLDACVREQVASGNVGFGNGYALSKAALSALTIIQGNLYPNLKVVSLSPGFIATPMTAGRFFFSFWSHFFPFAGEQVVLSFPLILCFNVAHVIVFFLNL